MTQATPLHASARAKSPVLPALAVFLVMGILLLPFYRYELSPDGISYLSIAQQYTAGYWNEAVNAYWAPLYSWCIALLLLVRMPGILATKIVALAAGVVALFALWRMSINFDMNARIQRAFIWTASFVVLAFALETNTPDLLFVAVLLIYLALIFDPAYPSMPYAGVICGVLGSLAYLAKSYGFFFFAAHFLIFSALHWVLQKDRHLRRRIAGQLMRGLTIFCCLSFAWVVILHAKYGRWMLGTTSDFNHRLVGPQSSGYPHFRGLLAPPTEHAITAWQDPAPSLLPDWNTFGSSANISHQFKVVGANSWSIFRFWMYANPLFGVFLLAYVVLCFHSPIRSIEWVFPLLTIVLFSLGYIPLTVQGRYLWLTDLLLLWIAFRTLDLLFKSAALSGSAKALLVSVAALTFLISPLRTLRAHFLHNRNLHSWTEDIKRSNLVRGKLASCGDWQDSAYVAYMLDMPYYGVPAAVPEADETARELNPDYRADADHGVDPNEIPKVLSKADIDYFIEWPSCGPAPEGANTPAAQAGDIKVMRRPR
jgi:hypothetical protein